MLLYLEIDVSFYLSLRLSVIFWNFLLTVTVQQKKKKFYFDNVQECSLFDEVYRVLSDHDVIYGGPSSSIWLHHVIHFLLWW